MDCFDTKSSRRFLAPLQKGSVLFMGPNFRIDEDNAHLFYDDTQNFLGVGTNVPESVVDIVGPPGEDLFEVRTTAANSSRLRVRPGSVIINDDNDSVDFIIGGNVTGTLLFMDPTTDRFLIGSGGSPTHLVHIQGNAQNPTNLFLIEDSAVNDLFRVTVSGTVVNDDGLATHDFRAESDNQTHMVFVQPSTNRVAVGTSVPVGTFEVAGLNERIILGNVSTNSDSSTVVVHGKKTGININGLDYTTRQIIHDATLGFGLSRNLVLNRAGNSTIFTPFLSFAKSRGTIDSPTVNGIGDTYGNIQFLGYGGTTFQESALIAAEYDHELASSPSDTNMPGRLVFATTQVNNTSATERMRITQSGLVSINQPIPSHLLHVTGYAGHADLLLIEDSVGSDQFQVQEGVATGWIATVGGTAVDVGGESITAIRVWPNGLTRGGGVGEVVSALEFIGLVTIDAGEVASNLNVFRGDPSVTYGPGVATPSFGAIVFTAQPKFDNSQAGLGVLLGAAVPIIGLQFAPTFSISGGGGATLAVNSVIGVRSVPAAIPAGVSVVNLRHFYAQSVSVAGALTLHVGYDCDVGTGATAVSYRSTSSLAQMRHEGPAIFGNNVPTTASVSLEASFNGTPMAFLTKPMTTGNRDSLTATDGMIIYNSSLPDHQVRRNGVWVHLPWDAYAPAVSFTIQTGRFVDHIHQLILAGSETATLEGTARLVIHD